MIEINLIPDVKQEFVRAQRLRATIISLSVLVAIAFGATVALLAIWVFGAQTLRGNIADGQIKDKAAKLLEVKDLDKALTVQNQLAVISDKHRMSPVDSRVFDILTTVVPSGENAVQISNFSVDTTEHTVTIDGVTSGYRALEAFKKTILATKFEYKLQGDDQTKSEFLTTQITDGDRSFGQDPDGRQVLRFVISFIYSEKILSREALNGKIVAPQASNVTDSALQVPTGIFTNNPKKEGDK